MKRKESNGKQWLEIENLAKERESIYSLLIMLLADQSEGYSQYD